LRYGSKPAFAGARVEWVGKPEQSPAAVTSDRAAGDEAIHHPRDTILVRRNIGQVLGVR
jgi:hypothetical protein